MTIYQQKLQRIILTQEYIIYRAINLVNRDSYIGYSYNFKERQDKHKYDSFNENSKEYNYYFHNAIRKYGWDNFKWEIIYTSHFKYFTWDVMEPFYIKLYGTYTKDPDYKGGYNMTPGGNRGPDCTNKIKSEKTKKRHSDSLIGIKFSNERKQNISKGLTGKIQTEEHIDNRRNSMIENGTWTGGRCLTNKEKDKKHLTRKDNTKDLKKYILKFPDGHEKIIGCLRYFCDENDISYRGLQGVLSGNQKEYKGFTIKRYEDLNKPYPNEITKKETIRQSRIGNPEFGIIVIHPDNTESIIYSLAEFCEEKDLSYNNMNAVLLGKRNHHKGFICKRLIKN